MILLTVDESTENIEYYFNQDGKCDEYDYKINGNISRELSVLIKAGKMITKILNGSKFGIKIDFNECPNKDELLKEFNSIVLKLNEAGYYED